MEKINKIVTVLRHSFPEKDDNELVLIAQRIVEAIKIVRKPVEKLSPYVIVDNNRRSDTTQRT